MVITVGVSGHGSCSVPYPKNCVNGQNTADDAVQLVLDPAYLHLLALANTDAAALEESALVSLPPDSMLPLR